MARSRPVEDIEGVGEVLGRKLREAGVRTTRELLQAAAKEGIAALAARTGIDAKRLSAFVHMAELMRIDGIGPQAAELLVAAGVEGLAGLAREDAEALARRVREVNAQHPRTTLVPTAARLARWIAEAKRLAEAGVQA